MKEQIHLYRCGESKRHRVRPESLGMMQPEGHPQQGKLKTWTKGVHAAGTDPRDLGMMKPWGRSHLKMELEGCHLMMLGIKGC